MYDPTEPGKRFRITFIDRWIPGSIADTSGWLSARYISGENQHFIASGQKQLAYVATHHTCTACDAYGFHKRNVSAPNLIHCIEEGRYKHML
jgi:hypothetical protein